MRVNAAIEHHLRKSGHVACGGKKSGVAGDAAHGPGILIVHFAVQIAACGNRHRFPWARFARAEMRGGLNRVIAHSERRKDVTLRELRQCLPGEAFDDFAQQNESQIGIFHLRAGFAHQRFGHHACQHGIVTLCVLVKIAMSRESGIVQQQHPHGDFRAPGRVRIGLRRRGKLRQVTRHRRVEIEPFLLHEHHRRVVVTIGLRQRRDVVNRVRRHLGRFRIASEFAERMHGQLIVATRPRARRREKRRRRNGAIEQS